ncbi:hypothetical protein ABPG75_010240 [Micractinium tetrahymenae]
MAWGIAARWLRATAPEQYFFFYNASIVFILPYLSILWKDQGFSGAQIGVLSAVRPFICSVSGQLLVGVADAKRWHYAISIVTYLVTMAARSSMVLATGFVAHLLLILISEACQSPFSIMTDAAIAATSDEAGYGRKRVLASLGWGSLAPLSGWIAGKYGVPHSIAIYLALVSVAFVPTALLPLRELGRKRGLSSQQEAAPGGLARSSGNCSALLLPGGGSSDSSGNLDSRQHNGHAAELAIELLGAPPEKKADAGPAGGDSLGDALAERIGSKLAQAQAREDTLRPLLTTADEDAAAQAAGVAAGVASSAASQSHTAAAQDEEDSWSIAAVPSPRASSTASAQAPPSPLAARLGSLPPIACPHEAGDAAQSCAVPIPLPAPSPSCSARSGAAGMPGVPLSGTPVGSSHGAAAGSGLARTTSAATTAFFSVRSGPSFSSAPGSAGGLLLSPRGEAGVQGPRSALLRQLSDLGSLATPRTARALVAGQQPALVKQPHVVPVALPALQVSNVSQALNGFDQSILEDSISDGSFLTPRADSFLPAQPDVPDLEAAAAKAGLQQGLWQVHTVHPPRFLASTGGSGRDGRLLLSDGSERQLRRRTSSRSLLPLLPGGQETAKSPLLAALELPLEPAAPDSEPLLPGAGSEAGSNDGLPAVALSIGEGGASGHGSTLAAEGAAASGQEDAAAKRKADLSVWAGIRQLLRNPHHAAFFATAFLMGIGYGFLGYETLYLKESGAPGLLIGICLLVNTCGEMPLFATSGYWLPKLGHELAFSIGMAGWVLRLALYTLLPLFPSVWCVLPVELLQGLTFAVSYGVGTVHAKAIAPVHLRSTCQSCFFCMFYGVGPGISGLAGGLIYESLGMRFVFVIGSCTLFFGWAIIQLVLRWVTRHERAQQAAAAALAP